MDSFGSKDEKKTHDWKKAFSSSSAAASATLGSSRLRSDANAFDHKKANKMASAVSPSQGRAPMAGCVLSIQMKNFMTFRDVVVKPGMGFNVVVGPNGAGKSSIVSALTLGLGGDVATLGRQKNLDQFINVETGADEAEIRIVLSGDKASTSDHHILCRISRGAVAGQFWINDGRSSKKVVSELARRLHIQTDNLCQFLPQDVVRNFAQMSPADIFGSTLRALGDHDTLRTHAHLVEIKANCADLERDLALKRDTAAGLRKKCRTHARALEHISRRRNLEGLIDDLQLRKQYLLVKKKKAELTALQREKTAVGERVEAKKAQHAELSKSLSGYRRQVSSLNSAIAKEAKAVKDINAGLKDADVAQREAELTAVCDKIFALGADGRTRQKKLDKLRERAAALAQEARQLEAQGLEGKVALLEAAHDRAAEAVGPLTARVAEANGEVRESQERLATWREQLTKLHTFLEKMRGILLERNEHAYQGHAWLQEPQVRAAFRGTIYPPLMLIVKVKNGPAHGDIVEKLIGATDLESFLCEDAADASALMNALRRDRGLRKTSVVHHSLDRRPLTGRRPDVPAALRPHFVDFAVDLIKCPPTVESYLIHRKGLDSVPVFEEGAVAHLALAERHFSRFFVGKKLHVVKRSRYGGGGETFSLIEDLRGRRPSCFAQERPDEVRITALKAQVDEEEAALADKQARLEKARDSLRKANTALNKAKNELDQAEGKRRMKVRKALEAAQAKNQIAAMESNNRDAMASAEETMEALVQERRWATNRLSGTLESLADATTEAAAKEERLGLSRLRLQQVEAGHSVQTGKLSRLDKELESLLREQNARATSFRQGQNEFRAMYDALRWEGQNTTIVPADVKARLNEAGCPKKLPEVEAKLVSTVRDLSELPHYSENRVAEIHAAREAAEKSEADVVKMEEELSAKAEEAAEKDAALSAGIADTVERISRRFGELMESLGNAGSVELEGHRMEEQPDQQGRRRTTAAAAAAAAHPQGDGYKLNILVRFRDGGVGGAGMQRLSAGVHSGGEKSVVTALYMLALQEMSMVPFRCADEINQGMDERNERMVWARIMETADRFSAQYFYLAPKFPRDLAFNDAVTAVVCHNGEVRKRGSRKRTMDVDGVIKKMRKKKKLQRY